MSDVILSVKNLVTEFSTDEGRVRAVDDVSFDLKQGETLGIVGESGCGKSVTALSIMRLLPQPVGEIVSGQILLQGQNLVSLSLAEMQKVRGARIGMVFQEPMTALNPVHTIGSQVAEPLRLHLGLDKTTARQRAIALLDRVGIPQAAQRFDAYPHQFSGGQRQRIGIARALAVQPELILCDEPVSALDVSVQAEVVNLLQDLQEQFGLTYLFIAHDLAVVEHVSDHILVMSQGRIVEQGTPAEILGNPQQAYTKTLLAAVPRF